MKNSNKVKFFLISLGCPKNQVDIEYLAHMLGTLNWSICLDPQEADVSIINTCAFINDAKEESIEMIFEMLNYGPVIVTGCLPQLYGAKLRDLMPEISIFTGTESTLFAKDIDRAFREKNAIMLINNNQTPYNEFTGRMTLSRYHAYIKISEGCSRACSYCIIPRIRGPVRSRMPENIKKEIEYLYSKGFREFELVSEDAALYGADLGNYSMTGLINYLDEMDLEGLQLRLMYIYPDSSIRDIADAIAGSRHFIRYMDVPFQHVSQSMLERMNREIADIRSISEYITKKGILLRTSLMTGFPGETYTDYKNMKQYIIEGYADRVGIFKYSDEGNTRSAGMKGKLSRNSISARHRVLYSEAMKILDIKMREHIGNTENAVFYYRDGDYSIGRLMEDAPEIDPLCIYKGHTELNSPVYVNVCDVSNLNYVCEVINES